MMSFSYLCPMMKTTNNKLSVLGRTLPKDYIFCFLSDCPLSETCARSFAVGCAGQREVGAAVLPAALKNGECRWYRPFRKFRGAWGFNSLFEAVKAKDAPALRRAMKGYLGGNGTYYLYHHGGKLLTPEQQEWILSLFKRYGYEDALVFDGYKDDSDW